MRSHHIIGIWGHPSRVHLDSVPHGRHGLDAVHGVDRYFVAFLDEARDELRRLGAVAGWGERGVGVEEDS